MMYFNKKPGTKLIKYVCIVVFILYISYLIYLTFFDRQFGREMFHRRINIVPFLTITQFLNSSHKLSIIMTNIAGNIMAFLPMGFLLPVVFTRLKSLTGVLISVLAATVSIEMLQYIAAVGTTDIDDIILNVLGGIMGYFLYISIMRMWGDNRANIDGI